VEKNQSVKNQHALFISIVLNAVLLGWMFFSPGASSQHGNYPVNAGSLSEVVTVSVSPSATNLSETQAGNPPHTSILDWRQIESADYKQYIANLHAIGCPSSTIKEIIAADVKDLYASRRATITRTNRYEYWRETPLNVTEQQRKQLRELDEGKAETLKALGVDASDFSNLFADYFRNEVETKDRELDFLSESKRQLIMELRSQEIRQISAADQASQSAKDIDEKTELAIKSLLTPEELHEYDLRTSVLSAQLRSVFEDLQPSEQEFRFIHDTWNNLQTKPAGSDEYREAQKSSEVALRQMLESNRFEIYLRGVKILGYAK
jgi:hypothetical protein